MQTRFEKSYLYSNSLPNASPCGKAIAIKKRIELSKKEYLTWDGGWPLQVLTYTERGFLHTMTAL